MHRHLCINGAGDVPRAWPIRRVAIVGAGPIGISMAKYLIGEDCFDKIDVYEQQSSFGGAWIWSRPQPEDKLAIPQTSPFGPLDKIKVYNEETADVNPPTVMTPMYDDLETNIPYGLMTFSDKKFAPDVPILPFRTTVLEYIAQYGHEIKDFVHFGKQVTSIKMHIDEHELDRWKLSSKDVKTGEIRETEYDAVALCNGHFSLPSVPNIPGIKKWNIAYPGSVMHSKWYRNPKPFTGKKVVIVGNAASGVDIGSQIADVCKKPLIMSAHSEPLFQMPSYAEHLNVPMLVEFLDPSQHCQAVRFTDGRIEENVDIVLFCTGYFLSFPFLEQKIQTKIINTGHAVMGTYKHIFWIEHPTLAFMGLPNKVLPMPLGEAQACAVSRVWSGRLPLPSIPQMQIWEHERWRQQADLLKMKGKPTEAHHIEKAMHAMGYPQDMDYHNDLVAWARQAAEGVGRHLPHVWGEREKWIRTQMAPIKKAYADLGDKKYTVRTLEELGFDYEKYQAEKAEKERQVALEEKANGNIYPNGIDVNQVANGRK